MSAWRKTFACAFCAQILSIMGFSFALPFLPFFLRDLGVTDPAGQAWWAGVILAATGVTLAAFAPIWGAVADRFGRKPMVVRSMFGGAVVVTLMSFSRTPGELLAWRLVQGAVTGTVSASIALVASVSPPRRSGFTLGMMQAAVLTGVAIGPMLGGLLADAFGYRIAFRVGAGVILLAGLLVQFGARESFQPAPRTVGENRFRLSRAGAGVVGAVVILFAVRFSNTLINPSFPLIIQDMLSASQRLNSVTGMIMAAAGAAGAVTAGVLGHAGDRFGHRRIMIGCCLLAAVSSAAHAVARDIGGLTLAHLFFGMAVAGTMPAANAMIQKHTDPQHMGKAFGAATAISLVGVAFGPFVGGFLAGRIGLRAPFLAAAVCQVGVALLAVRLAPRSTLS